MERRGLSSKLWAVLELLADLMLLNLLWLVCSLPVLTLGTSTAALYGVTLGMRRGEAGSVAKRFFQAFRSNFKQAALAGLFLLLPAAALGYALWFFFSGAVALTLVSGLLFLLPALFFMQVCSLVFPLISQFRDSAGRALRNAVLMALAHFPASLSVGLLNLLPILLLGLVPAVFLRMSVLWLFIGFAATAYINAAPLLRIFRKYAPLP